MNSKSFTSSLKAVLRSRGIQYEQVAEHIGVSESTVKRWFSSGGMSLERYAEILEMTDVKLEDLARLVDSRAESEIHHFTEEQEEAMVREPKIYAFFNILATHRRVSHIEKKYGLSRRKIVKFLKTLDDLELIEWKEKYRYRFLVPKKIAWRKNGPLRRQFLSEAKSEFLSSEFTENRSTFRFLNLQLSKKASSEVIEKISKVLEEAASISEVEKSVNSNLEDVGLLVAVRPWSFSKLKF